MRQIAFLASVSASILLLCGQIYGATLTGVVSDSSGVLGPGLLVTVHCEGSSASLEARTDAAGFYRVVTTSNYSPCYVSHSSGCSSAYEFCYYEVTAGPVEITERDHVRIDLRLVIRPPTSPPLGFKKYPAIAGVLLSESGDPLQGASLCLLAGSTSHCVTSDDRGRYFMAVPPGTFDLTLSGRSGNRIKLGKDRLELAPGQVAENEVVLQQAKGGLVTGRVEGRGGKPVEGCKIVVAPTKVSGTSDRQGNYRVWPVDRRVRFLAVNCPNHVPIEISGLSVNRGSIAFLDVLVSQKGYR